MGGRDGRESEVNDLGKFPCTLFDNTKDGKVVVHSLSNLRSKSWTDKRQVFPLGHKGEDFVLIRGGGGGRVEQT